MRAQPRTPCRGHEPGAAVRAQQPCAGGQAHQQIGFLPRRGGSGIDEPPAFARAERSRPDPSEGGLQREQKDIGQGRGVGEGRLGGGRVVRGLDDGIRGCRGQPVGSRVLHRVRDRGVGAAVVVDEGAIVERATDLADSRDAVVHRGDERFGFRTREQRQRAGDRGGVEQRVGGVEHVAPRRGGRHVAIGEEAGEDLVVERAQRDRQRTLVGGLGHVSVPCWRVPFARSS